MNWTIGFKAIVFRPFRARASVYGARCGCCTGASVCVYKAVHADEQPHLSAETP